MESKKLQNKEIDQIQQVESGYKGVMRSTV